MGGNVFVIRGPRLDETPGRGRAAGAVATSRIDRKFWARKQALYDAIVNHGRLHVGWSCLGCDVRDGQESWTKRFRKWSDDWDDPPTKPRDEWKLVSASLEISPGDIVVVPTQPATLDDPDAARSFLVARTRRIGGGTGCVGWRTGRLANHEDDFHQFIGVEKTSVRHFNLADRETPKVVREKLRTYGRRVTPVRSGTSDAFIKAVKRLVGGKDTNPAEGSSGDSRVKSDRVAHYLKDFKRRNAGVLDVAITGGKKRRVRAEMRLQNKIAAALGMHLKVSDLWPADLFVNGAIPVLFEAKVVGSHPEIQARAAVGQLWWYEFELGDVIPSSTRLCVVFDKRPPDRVASFIEEHCNECLAWLAGKQLVAAKQSHAKLAGIGVRLASKSVSGAKERPR